MTPIFARVDRLWPESTVVCIGTGPSLTQSDVDLCRGRARVIVVNKAYHYAPWADAMYACDAKLWKWENGAPDFQGLKYALEPQPKKWPGVQVLKNLGRTGLSVNPAGLKTGHDSGYQAINLAVLLGARSILLLGYDMQVGAKGRMHVHKDHPDKTKPPFAKCLAEYPTLVAPLKALGISVVNCTRSTALHVFPQSSLDEAFRRLEQAA